VRRRDTLKSLACVGLGVISGVPDTYFSNWESEVAYNIRHYWWRDGKVCFEYKEGIHSDTKIMMIYTAVDGELASLVVHRQVDSRREAIEMFERYKLGQVGYLN